MQAHFTLNRLDLPSRYPCPSQEALENQCPKERLAEGTAGQQKARGSREKQGGQQRSGKRCEMTVN